MIKGGHVSFYIIFFNSKVMASTFAVFATWDDEYDRLQQILRDMAKKKRDDSLKTMWRVNPSHKKLQARVDTLRK